MTAVGEGSRQEPSYERCANSFESPRSSNLPSVYEHLPIRSHLLRPVVRLAALFTHINHKPQGGGVKERW